MKQILLQNARASNNGLTDHSIAICEIEDRIDKLESRVYGHHGCAGGCAPLNPGEKETQSQEVEKEKEEGEIDDSLTNGSSNSSKVKKDEEDSDELPEKFEIEWNDEADEVKVDVVLKRKGGDEMRRDFARRFVCDFARQWQKRRRIEITESVSLG